MGRNHTIEKDAVEAGIEEEIDIEIRTVKNCPSSYDNTERVLIIDGDSAIWMALYNPEPKPGDIIPEIPFDFEEAKFRFRKKLQEITNNVDQYFNIVKTMLFIGGKNNFRYIIYPEYKANRKTKAKPEFFKELTQYAFDELGAITAPLGECDDIVYESTQIARDNCILAAIDKDYKSFYSGYIYDYRTHGDTLGKFIKVEPEECKLYFARQLVCGDNGDNIKGAKRVGEVWCDQNLFSDMTDYQLFRQVFRAYLKANKDDIIAAKKDMKLNHNLIKLWKQEEIIANFSE